MVPLVAEMPYWAMVVVILAPGIGLLVMFWQMRRQAARQKTPG
jgi:hypothetical protein